MRTLFGLMLPMTLLSTLAATSAGAVEEIKDKLPGTYSIVSGQEGDREISEDELNGTVVINEEMMILQDNDNKELYALSYQIKEQDKDQGCKVDMKVIRSTREGTVGSQGKGLLKFEDDKVTIIYEYAGKDYPADFEPKGRNQNKFVLKRKTE